MLTVALCKGFVEYSGKYLVGKGAKLFETKNSPRLVPASGASK